jgi:hypothetical protein
MINLTLTLDQVNVTLNLLAKNPYELCAEIINEIREQALPQIMADPQVLEESSDRFNKDK